MFNCSKVLPIITGNNLPAIIETSICASVIFQFIALASESVVDYKKDGHFLISDKPEKDLIDGHGGQPWLVPLSIVMSGYGLGMILSAFGYF